MDIGFFYVPYYPLTTGASVHGFQLVRGLKKRGHRILSCLGDGNPDCINFERTKAGAISLARKADVLYIRIATFSFLEKATLLKLLRPFSLPVVWEVNAPVEELKGSYSPGRERDALISRENRKRKILARLVDAGIGVSEPLREYIQNFLDIRKSYCIPNASDPGIFDPDKAKATVLDHLRGKLKVCWAGNASTPWQGIELVIDLAKKMEETDPDVVFIIITGDSLWPFPVLRNLMVLRQVPYGDLPHYLFSMDICLCLYQDYDCRELGFYNSSLKFFDYLAAGKPVIASCRGQLSEIIRHEVNGMLVENHIDTIINLLRMLKSDPEQRKRLGATARNDVINFYNWDRVAQQTEDVLKQACKLK
ncbi:MAG: glycosyltransferase [Pseudomonadota bacterium]